MPSTNSVECVCVYKQGHLRVLTASQKTIVGGSSRYALVCGTFLPRASCGWLVVLSIRIPAGRAGCVGQYLHAHAQICVSELCVYMEVKMPSRRIPLCVFTCLRACCH